MWFNVVDCISVVIQQVCVDCLIKSLRVGITWWPRLPGSTQSPQSPGPVSCPRPCLHYRVSSCTPSGSSVFSWLSAKFHFVLGKKLRRPLPPSIASVGWVPQVPLNPACPHPLHGEHGEEHTNLLDQSENEMNNTPSRGSNVHKPGGSWLRRRWKGDRRLSWGHRPKPSDTCPLTTTTTMSSLGPSEWSFQWPKMSLSLTFPIPPLGFPFFVSRNVPIITSATCSPQLPMTLTSSSLDHGSFCFTLTVKTPAGAECRQLSFIHTAMHAHIPQTFLIYLHLRFSKAPLFKKEIFSGVHHLTSLFSLSI